MTPVIQRLAGLLVDSELKDIEILPGDESDYSTPENRSPFAPFLFVEGHLGIPKKVLYRLYVAAVTEFSLSKSLLRSPHRGDLTAVQEATIRLLSEDELTSVILLTNPDHNTALNRRKDLISDGSLDPSSELILNGHVLGVAKNSKASLLWHHRRWLLKHLYGGGKERMNQEADSLHNVTVPTEQLIAEFALCAKGAALYRRNYHAWAHRFKCLESLKSSLPGRATEDIAILVQEHAEVRSWVESNVTDHTAMQYLCRVDEVCRRIGGNGVIKEITNISLIDHAKGLVSRYPDHESLWLYLREAYLSSRSSAEGSREVQARTSALPQHIFPLSSLGDISKIAMLQKKHSLWCQAHEIPSHIDIKFSHSVY